MSTLEAAVVRAPGTLHLTVDHSQMEALDHSQMEALKTAA